MKLHYILPKYIGYVTDVKLLTAWTLKCYIRYLNRFVKYCEDQGVMNVSEISLMLITDFMHELRMTPVNKGSKRYSQNPEWFIDHNTVIYHLRCIRKFIGWCRANEIRCIDASFIEIPHLRIKEIPFLSDEELNLVLNAPLKYERIPRIAKRNRLLFGVWYYCWLRISESLQLKMKPLLNDEYIEVIGKMNIRRRIRIPNIIRIWAREYEEARVHKWEVERAFASHNHFNEWKPLAFDGVRAMIRKYNRKIGMKKSFHYHLLRHSYATNLLRQWEDMRTVQLMLGHRCVKSTQMYTHIGYDTLKRAQEKLIASNPEYFSWKK